MSHTLTSSESVYLLSLWERYDAAATAGESFKKSQLRKVIELYVISSTYRRVIFDLQAKGQSVDEHLASMTRMRSMGVPESGR